MGSIGNKHSQECCLERMVVASTEPDTALEQREIGDQDHQRDDYTTSSIAETFQLHAC